MVRQGDPRPTSAPRDRTHPALLAGIALTLLAFGVAAWWGLESGPPGIAHMGEAVAIPGGEMLVTGVRPEILASMNMPGVAMPDMAPQGYRRFIVEIELRGAAGGGIAYEPRKFQVAADELPPAGPQRSAYPAATVPRGETLSVTLLFQAPERAGTLTLSYAGAARQVLLEGDLGIAHGHGSDSGAAPEFTLKIAKNRYSERRLAVRLGDRVRWVNEEPTVSHTVTFESGPAASPVLGPRGQFDVTFDTLGTFEYVCTIHPSMRGLVVVTPRE